MMMATCRGTAPDSARPLLRRSPEGERPKNLFSREMVDIGSGWRRSENSDLENIFFFPNETFVQLLDVAVGEFLSLIFRPTFVIF
ncbi:MAG: hypothetical protein BWY79_01161 [Actinobacteria bacterium ADurb.Bin444]|nr:MAG: hypothetical protein BWY79_01161 [Actinobacteria bacterium ADurb.Bin444]